ncbi:hypothetical protein EES45_23640 [Streptomyces sp. ADI97-07]|nr:hypothetical protein EES45_23640 [Streptomyces sp. ADI97-07]
MAGRLRCLREDGISQVSNAVLSRFFTKRIRPLPGMAGSRSTVRPRYERAPSIARWVPTSTRRVHGLSGAVRRGLGSRTGAGTRFDPPYPRPVALTFGVFPCAYP